MFLVLLYDHLCLLCAAITQGYIHDIHASGACGVECEGVGHEVIRRLAIGNWRLGDEATSDVVERSALDQVGG